MSNEQINIFGFAEGKELPLVPSWNNATTARWSLREAREYVDRHAREEGIECPCCGQMARVYTRVLNSGMARALVLMYRAAREKIAAGARLDEAWIDIRKIDVRGGDYAKLVYWHLIESGQARDDAGNSLGMWRLTARGFAFVESGIAIEKRVRVYDGRVLNERSVDTTTLSQALGARFSLNELMEGR